MNNEKALVEWLKGKKYITVDEESCLMTEDFEKEHQWELSRNCFINKVIKFIEEQPKVNEWIPCSERLPNCNGCYLVWRPHFFGGEIGMPAICYFDGQDSWHDSYGVDFTRILNKEDVLAWMELPESYKA